MVLYVCFAFFSTTVMTRYKEARFIFNFVPVFFLLVAWGYACLLSLPRAWVLQLVLAGGLVYGLSPLSDSIKNNGRMRGLCYGDAQSLEILKSRFIDKVAHDTQGTTIGISDLTYMSPLVTLELNRANPKFSHWPEPVISDYGYHTSALEYVRRQLASGELHLVAVFHPTSGKMTEDAKAAAEAVKNSSALHKVDEFSLEKLPYRVELYAQ
jgi:hypothetical protein